MKKKWGVVQLVGHLTVNEDGEGSNPSAPAKFYGSKNIGIVSVGKRNRGVSGPLVGTIVELNGLRACRWVRLFLAADVPHSRD
jgi:hypothetical protein